MQGFREDKLSFLPLLLVPPLIALVVLVASNESLLVAERVSFSGTEARAIRRTESLLAGLPQRGAALGDPDAPVTLQFFGDLQCVQSRQVMLGALPFLIRHWVRGGELRIVYRSTKSDTPDWSEFRGQQIAALAAGRERKTWTFVDLFYREQGPEFTRYADDGFLERIAEQARLDLRRWTSEREVEGWAAKIESEDVLAREHGLRSTPSFLIGPTGGRARPLLHFSLEEPRVFDEAIRGLL